MDQVSAWRYETFVERDTICQCDNAQFEEEMQFRAMLNCLLFWQGNLLAVLWTTSKMGSHSIRGRS